MAEQDDLFRIKEPIMQSDKPKVGDKPKIYWHPDNGDVSKCDATVTVELVAPGGVWWRQGGKAAFASWPTWARMTGVQK